VCAANALQRALNPDEIVRSIVQDGAERPVTLSDGARAPPAGVIADRIISLFDENGVIFQASGDDLETAHNEPRGRTANLLAAGAILGGIGDQAPPTQFLG